MIDLALFQPDIPGNTGALLRLGACMGVQIHIIEPAGFRLDEKSIRRAGMDYVEMATMQRHLNWQKFEEWRTTEKRRLILLTTRSDIAYTSYKFEPTDMVLLGRESAGVPDDVHAAVDASLTIPMQGNARSLNVALSAAMVLGEALRQVAD